MSENTHEIRFLSGQSFKLLTGPYDDDRPEFDCVQPAHDDNGVMHTVDCWIINRKYEIHPGYNVSPVPIPVSSFTE